jgi:type IV secretory pathway VirB10-like protein
VIANNEEGRVPESNDDERALLGRYAHATSPTKLEVEHALTRTLARIESGRRGPSLPDPRRRIVWFAAAGLATLVIATAAFAGVRWLRVGTQPSEPPYDAARFEHAATDVDAAAITPTPEPEHTAPVPELPKAPEQTQGVEAEPTPSSTDAPAPKPRHRDRTEDSREPPVEQPEPSEPLADASELAEESRLLAKVRRALHDDDFEGALEWAEEHARRHPRGLLTEERLVLEAVAACRGGQRPRGLEAAKQLREQFPGTPTLAKVEQACGEG